MNKSLYTEVKDSNIESIGEIPESWNILKIKHAVETKITDGPHETPEILDEGIPFLSAEAVKKGKLNFNLKRGYISLKDHLRFSKKCKPQYNDIFMIKSGATTGEVAIVDTDEEFNIWSPLALIRVNQAKVLPKFMYYYISSQAFRRQVELGWNYGTQQNIGMGVIENLFMTLPSLEEQKQIALYIEDKVRELDKLIGYKERIIKLLEEKRQSIITESITKGLNPNAKTKDSGIEWIGEIPRHWNTVSIRNLLRNNVIECQDGNHGELHPISEDYVEEGIPFVMANNIRGNKLDLNQCKYISQERAEKLRIGFSISGDILLTHKGTVGEVAMVPHDLPFPFIMLTPQVTYYRVKKCNVITNVFLEYFFQSYPFKNQLKIISSMQSTRQYVGLVAQKELIIILPPIEEQSEIIKTIDEAQEPIKEAITDIRLQVEKLKEYRQSLIYEAVTGKIDVNVK